MKSILLTGATGFLGSHLLEGLIKSNYNVVIVKRSSSNIWRIEHLLNQVKSYDVDVVDSLEVVFQEQEINTIIHMATLYRKFDTGEGISDMVNTNILFPVKLLEIGIRNGVQGFINTGTYFEYDCSKLPIDEKSNTKPFNLYAKTKLAFETILKTYSDQLSVNTFRLFSPYGEKDNSKLIPMLIQKALNNKSIQLSDGLQKMDFIYARDIVQAYLKALEKMSSNYGSNGYQVYNLGSGVAISVREIVSIIEQQLEKTVDKTWGEPSILDIPIVFSNISKAINELGWTPKYTIHEGIANTIKYYKKRDLV